MLFIHDNGFDYFLHLSGKLLDYVENLFTVFGSELALTLSVILSINSLFTFIDYYRTLVSFSGLLLITTTTKAEVSHFTDSLIFSVKLNN